MIRLVLGATGFIGSHFSVAAMLQGKPLVLLDNFENSSPKVLQAIQSISGTEPTFIQADVRDKQALRKVFSEYQIDSVVHFAGYKAVGESSADPLKYFNNNVSGAITLLEVMKEFEVFNFLFSSSATVYGVPEFNPYTEEHPKKPFNPYGNTKSMVEDILSDLCASDSRWSAVALRYFNPIGAHPSGKIGEDPKGIPNNLMPYITKVAIGELESLGIFGNDYDTPDGTGVRDYIHVMDLADGHLKALDYISAHKGYEAINLGTGTGYSVLDLVQAFERVNGVRIPYQFKPRRAGDLPAYWANADKARKLLGWSAQFGIEDMVRDSWKWQSSNPEGFNG